MESFRVIRLAGLLLAAAAIPACLSTNPNRTAPQPQPISTVTTFKAAVLSGRQEVPPVVTSATGSASVEINRNRTEITVTVDVTGLSDITEAHLHVAPPTFDGPILFPLASAAFTSPLVVILTAADFHPAPNVADFESALVAIEGGRTYVNVHTAAHPDGEIRGQVGPTTLMASLSGTDVVPSVTTIAAGTMGITLSPDQTSMLVVFNGTEFGTATSAQINAGAFGENGPTLFPLASGFYQVPLSVSQDETTFTPQTGVATFNDAVDLMLSGNTYASVSTAANPGGLIRGQIGP